jgi:hypothetical protein
MSRSTLWFKSLFILSAGMLALPIYANATSTEAPYCSGEQLTIYQIANDYPGMMHSSTLYGVINTSQKSCLLKGGMPTIWGINNHGKVYHLSKNTQQNDPSIVVEPVAKNYISSDKLVWFSMYGHGDVASPFNTIHIMLPGIAKHVYIVQYDGYDAVTSAGADTAPTPLQKNAALWDALSNDACPGFIGKVWPIYFTKIVNCG